MALQAKDALTREVMHYPAHDHKLIAVQRWHRSLYVASGGLHLEQAKQILAHFHMGRAVLLSRTGQGDLPIMACVLQQSQMPAEGTGT